MQASGLSTGSTAVGQRANPPRRTPGTHLTARPYPYRNPGKRLPGLRRLRTECRAVETPAGERGDAEDNDEEGKSDDYSVAMQARMGGSLTYRHEDGINFAYVLPDVIVGSCPQGAADVDKLVEEGVATIFCLQEDHDAEYFGFTIDEIEARCVERGDITHVRSPVRDFDPFSLRLNLPTTWQKRLYPLHRRAGAAPGTALAYLYWVRGMPLMEAHAILMEVRPCHPKLEAIKEATCDVLFEGSRQKASIVVYRFGTTKKIQVSGLDVGWGEMLDLEYDTKRGCFILERDLLPGKYPYKFICDGLWGYSADHPTFFDGEHTNNYLMVSNNADEKERQDRVRLMSANPCLNEEEQARIKANLMT
eukprot:CAMPEP_0177795800 /NCGR_PEP_ID=MMETSP0491_2-20121128/26436_1 /TAXON_ID=63592 /ORGANISM="Tetraselmis chuii, Strain PLY429" /LENGTH=362 /DNA_ID=CAMNT_0019318675 /DNA_START=177 /DNA_END=1266 /DNA_ORIENTATION=+